LSDKPQLIVNVKHFGFLVIYVIQIRDQFEMPLVFDEHICMNVHSRILVTTKLCRFKELP